VDRADPSVTPQPGGLTTQPEAPETESKHAQAKPEAWPELGRYRLLERLGSGGYGVVYRGYDEQLCREVAVKVSHRHCVLCDSDAESYQKEARILASLDHANILPVYDFGRTADGLCYLVSKLIVGASLAERIRQGPIPLHESVELVARIAEALHYAHGHGLVHRDIKPGNILLFSSGEPCIADFGLAWREEFGNGPSIAGTPAYMAPEQLRGEGHLMDARADIYSLGVVLYEVLAGKRPFIAPTQTELIRQIKTLEPRPPRQIDHRIPRQLDWICLKTLSKRAAERYSTALDLAQDLRHWQASNGGAVSSRPASIPGLPTEPLASINSSASQSREQLPVRIVPKGLRSFEAEDADFFMELLPGPRHRDGLPESIHFWKTRIESTNPERTFRIGLMYGPSGCGKSSLVKAGLFPQLASSIAAIYVECAPDGTEVRLLKALQSRCPDLNKESGLVQSLARLRREPGLGGGKKVLLILDQFEQWLHRRGADDLPELIEALRQCDGEHLQCLVLVRDDFWMASTRFMSDLEVPLVEGKNSAAVDLFDLQHARKVLAAFGRAFDRLPRFSSTLSREQERFLDDAISQLTSNGKVVPVRLSLFAEMMKARSWTGATLKEAGGSEGIGVAFLEETFSAPTAPPEHRLHQQAAQTVLKALLPAEALDLKGRMRSRQELLDASGYQHRPREFAQLLRILDVELRLITPVDPEEAPALDGDHYLLSHDYLVPRLREWLTRKQRETMHGRAEYQLADRTRLWTARPERRQLPGWWEWCRIRLLTSRRAWTQAERKMMMKAGRFHGVQAALALVAIALLGLAAWEGYDYLRARSLVSRLASAEPADVPRIVETIGAHRRWADGMLALMLTEGRPNSHQQILARAALAPADSAQVDPLVQVLWNASPQDVLIIRQALLPYRAQVVQAIWEHAQDPKAPSPERFRAACALASLDPEDSSWSGIAEAVSGQLVSESPLALSQWLAAIDRDKDGHPPFHVRSALSPYLGKTFRESGKPTERVMASNILATFVADRVADLFDLVLDADPEEYRQFVLLLRQHSQAAIPLLLREIDRPVPSEETDADALVRRQAQAAVTLLRLEWPEPVWPLLKRSPDPSRRTYLIHDMAKLGADPKHLINRLLTETDISVRRALILSLGEFDRTQITDRDREALVSRLLDWYRNDPDPGIHSALDWLLRNSRKGPGPRQLDWRGRQALEQIDREMAGQPPQKRDWYVNSEGQTFDIISDAPKHMNFAIATRKVSVAEFQRFLDAHPEVKKSEFNKRYSPEDDGPIIGMSWFEAAQYCNWLSEREGIPKSQLCYPDFKALKPGMIIADDMAKLSGYRMPTEAEWECAARAGTTSTRFYGSSAAMLGEYAWYNRNTDGARTRPLGQLKPNDFGLFDVYGNAWEWCQNRLGDSGEGRDPALTELTLQLRVIRGGSFVGGPSTLWSGSRQGQYAGEHSFTVGGLRLARTCR
jgi:serine/threonine protein kinase/formylglycine-generating enzyme required for sulfatase activity